MHATATATFVQFSLGAVAFVMERDVEDSGTVDLPVATIDLPGATTLQAALERIEATGWRVVGHPELVDTDGEYVVDVERVEVDEQPTITVLDHGSTFTVTVTDAGEERRTLTTPSGRNAGYPGAQRREMAYRIDLIRNHVADLLATPHYRGATAVGLDVLDALDAFITAPARSA